MRVNIRYKLLGICGAVLPAIPVCTSLMFRGVEAWKLWREMSQLTALGVIAWLWTVVYVMASLVTIFGLDAERELRRWEFLIDAGNAVSSVVLAIKCASQPFDPAHPIPYAAQFSLWLAMCLIPQAFVTYAARRARHVARRLQRQLKADRSKVPAPDLAIPAGAAVTAPSDTPEMKSEIVA